ncbi:MAG: polysaccharide deacetylase family protein [Rhodospirillaceae bacterium]|jgi:peptidoglycan-N-acetylglucosamine deacetylase|nr:polysaccharide deacetylase family protein [Rhodospirillaceae bacterium]MBT6137293.1 polysaccharide deacetylase family protein [Rhodospirillaceae bacterium]
MFEITLSFDNGPEPGVTPGVLDTLAKAEIGATFFVLGRKIAEPAHTLLMERAADEGHWIGNHTYTHQTPLGLSADPKVAEAEVGRTQALIGSLSHPDRLFRPFGDGGLIGPHLMNRTVAEYLKHHGFTCVLWNEVPRDWEDPEGWAATALEACRQRTWSLLVLHDLPTGAMLHLERFINDVRVAGGRFRQDYPPDCMPILRGQEVLPLTNYVTE